MDQANRFALLSQRQEFHCACRRTGEFWCSFFEWRELMEKYRSVIAINLSVFLLMVGVGLIVALLPQRIINLTGSISDVGILASAYAIPNVLLQIPIGHLSDRFGFKPFIVGGYAASALTGLLYFFADTPALFFGGRFLQGIAEIPIWALAPALLSVQYASDKGRHMGIYNAALHCGLTLGGLLSIISITVWHGNEPFLLFAVLSIIGGLITALFVDELPEKPTAVRTATASRRALSFLSDRINLLVFSGIFLYGAGYGIFITIVPAFLISAKHVSHTAIGVYFSLFYIALSFSQLLAGAWSDHKGRQPAMVIGLLIAGIGIAAFHTQTSTLAIAILFVSGLGLGIFCVSSMAFLNERVSDALKGTISGAFYFSWGAGYFFGPLLLGTVGNRLSFQVGFSGFAALIIMVFTALAIFIRDRNSTVTFNMRS